MNNKRLNIRKNLVIGKRVIKDEIEKKWLINAFYPEKFFIQTGKNTVKIKYLKPAEKLYKSN